MIFGWFRDVSLRFSGFCSMISRVGLKSAIFTGLQRFVLLVSSIVLLPELISRLHITFQVFPAVFYGTNYSQVKDVTVFTLVVKTK